ncbi:hypothetical protein QQZ08_010990 [Neonectria magnoliae]|uniref:Protein kinase domain-containing protein n=1 Tax=Neonectria magnoliae TaxID=2732573 RepID=A0ABR1HDW0_9HYPO
MAGNPLKGKFDIICYTPWSLVYIQAGDTKTLLKGRQVWCDGKSYEYRHLSFDGALEHEAAVYKKLGDHPRITRCYGLEEVGPDVHALRLERSVVGCIRTYIVDHPDEPPPIDIRLRMATDFAEGMNHLHEKGVTWYDASTRNALFFDDFRIKLCDFGTAVMEGTDFKQVQSYETRYSLPLRGRVIDELPPLERELFALGSAIYELTEWKVPYHGLTEGEVDLKVYDDEQPDLTTGNPAASIISQCWQEKYGSAGEIVRDLQNCVKSITQV